jgi:DNA-binding transcriptional LysR family regulator
MPRDTINDILAFLAVASERSFTRAASKLTVSQSALSQTIRALEEEMGVRLLTRTTRSVSPTEAGERLLQTFAPRFDDIEDELNAVSEMGGKPKKSIRTTAIDYAVDAVLWLAATREIAGPFVTASPACCLSLDGSRSFERRCAPWRAHRRAASLAGLRAQP